MAAATSCGQQAVSVRAQQRRTGPRERWLGGKTSHTLQARPLALVSALPELQHVKTNLKGVPESCDRSEIEESVIKPQSNNARRQGRKKKAAPSLLPESQGKNDSASLRRKSGLGFLSLVRSVDNAEDRSNESRNGATSYDASRTMSLNVGEESSEKNSFTLCQKVIDVQIDSDDAKTAVNVVNTSGDSSCKETHVKTSLEHTSASRSRKPQRERQRKSQGNTFEQDCGQSLLVTGFSDSKATAIGLLQEQCLTDEHENNDYAQSKTLMDVGIKPARLEYDVEPGKNVLKMFKHVDSMQPNSSSPSIAEEPANEARKMPGRKKKSKDAGKRTEFLDKNTLMDQSSTCEDGLSDQRVTSTVSPKKLLRHDDGDHENVFEAPDADESADKGRSIDAEGVVNKSGHGFINRAHSVMNIAVVDGSDLEGSLQRGGILPQNSKHRRSRKKHSTEVINAGNKACKVFACNEGLCTVHWLVETNLDKNHKLFLVGSNPHLGAWEPSMAIGFTLCEEVEKANLWQGHCQVPYGTLCEYNYFVQVGNEETNPLVWRPGPKFHLAVPSENSQETEMTIKDALDFNVANKLPALLWEGLQNEIGFPTELRRFFGDEVVLDSLQRAKLVNSEGDSSKTILKQKESPDTNVQNLLGEQKEVCQHEVQVGDVEGDILGRQMDDTTLNRKSGAEECLTSVKVTPKLRKFIRKRVFPREEPWLMESMILYEKSDMSKLSVSCFSEKGQEAEESRDAMVEKISEKREISTEILINSSKCTMERIAILENGNLVELLLKPVNSDINVGNVYLGIVKKLLPGMTGVFVDIGYSRVALLTITKNMYPFTFPPIACNENSSNGYELDDEGHLAGKQGASLLEIGQDLEKCDDVVEEEWETEDEDDEEDEASEVIDDVEELAGIDARSNASHDSDLSGKPRGRKLLLVNEKMTRPITVNFGQRFTRWRKVEEGMKIIVQVRREPLGKKGPKVCAFPQLSSRFWVLGMGGKSTGVSKKIHGTERKRLKELANLFRKPGFDLTVRTEAAGQSQEDLEKDLMRLLETWKDIMEQAEAASTAAQNGQDGAVPALLHRAMGQTLSIVRDFFAENVQRMVVDSAQTYHEVTSYLQEVAPQLQNRVELYTGTAPIFDVFNLEADIDKLLNERVQVANGAYLVIEETEALVTIDVNGGAGMLGKNMKSAAILEANLAAARQIAAELRLRDIGGIIVIDFIDMDEDEHESLVYEEMRKAIQSDRSIIYISEISELGLMELTRRRVRPSVTFMISDPCSCCRGTGRVEALETTFSKIERAILRLVVNHPENIHFDGRMWKKVLLRVDPVMFEFLTRKQRAAQLSSSLKVHIILKVGREMTRGSFELNELELGSVKRSPATTGQQQRGLRKAVRLGVGGKKDLASRT